LSSNTLGRITGAELAEAFGALPFSVTSIKMDGNDFIEFGMLNSPSQIREFINLFPDNVKKIEY
jgi:hypothetical protein